LDDDFFAVIEDPRIMPHFHLSIQSFADPVLRAMKRNYDAKLLETVLKKFRKLQRSDAAHISLGADLIVGFPGETQEDFLATCAGVQTFAINKLHIFPFSAHTKGQTVPASTLPHQIASAMIKAREAQLKSIGDEVRAAFLQRNIGAMHQVLVEGNGE
jgi:tRNA A37 methylthiotransferase MiaB